MKYKILIDYHTGDSFSSEDILDKHLSETDCNNLEVAKRNLIRIRDHYKYYQFINDRSYSSYHHRKEKEIEAKKIMEDVKKQDWFVEKYNFCLKLETDDGKFFQLSAFWCGYFESLYRARIELIKPEKELMEIRF